MSVFSLKITRYTAALLRLLCAMISPQKAWGRDDTAKEFWPEVDIWYRLDQRRRLIFLIAPTNDRETRDRSEGQFGLSLDYLQNLRVSYRINYLYLTSRVADETRNVENRLSTDFTYRWLPGKVLFANRVRLELRDINQKGSVRLRDRVKVEYITRIGGRIVAPYATAEAFYDSRYQAVSRFRFELGMVTPIANNAEAEINFGRQSDTRSSSRFVNGLGLTLTLRY